MVRPGIIVQTLRRSRESGSVIAPPPPPTNLPRAAITGLTARSFQQAQSTKGLINSMVYDPGADFVMTADGSALSDAFIAEMNSVLAYCAANPGTDGKSLRLALRIRFGQFVPQSRMVTIGKLPWYTRFSLSDTDQTQQDPLTSGYYLMKNGVAKWWIQAYFDYCRYVHGLVAARWGANPIICEVDTGIASTQFMEPCIRQAASQSNLNTLQAQGWTEALDDAAFVAGWKIGQDIWAPYGVMNYTSYNPPGQIVTTSNPWNYKASGYTSRAIALIQKQIAVAGPMTMLSNKSLENGKISTGAYADLYGAMINARTTQKVLSRFQTETFQKIATDYASGTNVQDTIEAGISQVFATSIEIPVGCEDPNSPPSKPGGGRYDAATYPKMYISPAQAADYNTRLAANAVGFTA